MNAIFGAMCTQQFQYPFENPHCWFPIFHSYFSGILGRKMANLMIGKFMMIESYNSLEEVHWSLPLHVMKILVSPNKSSKSWFLWKAKWSDLSEYHLESFGTKFKSIYNNLPYSLRLWTTSGFLPGLSKFFKLYKVLLLEKVWNLQKKCIEKFQQN